MTVGDAIDRAERMRPGIKLTWEEYLSHINRIDADIYSNIISCHQSPGDFSLHTSDSDILLVPDIYGDLYKYYILAMIDIGNGDITRYSNDMLLYNKAMSEYSDWYTRKHMPITKSKLRWY